MVDVIIQAGILCFGVSAVFLVASKRFHIRRWAYILGLMGQPFWAVMAWRDEGWGVGLLVAVYTFTWARGIYEHWIKGDDL